MPDEPEVRSADGPDEIDDFWVGESGSSSYDAIGEIDRIYNEFAEVMDDIESREPARDNITPLKPKERTLLLEFYSVIHAHLERQTAIILYEEIGGKTERDPWSTIKFFQQNFSQSKREDLLFHMELIDSGLKGELAKVRQARNELVHNQHKRMYIDGDNKSKSDIERARETVRKVESLLDEVT